MTKPKNAKSEEEPETNNEPVKIIVNKSFNRMVLNNFRDVFVLYYKPSDEIGSILEFWDQFAKSYQKVTELTIGKFNAEHNDSRDLK